MPGIRQTRGSTNRRPTGISTCLRILIVVMAWLPQQLRTVHSLQALTAGRHSRPRLLVQQGKLGEADRQARRALADPETRAVAYSILGTMRQLAHAKTLREEDEASSRLQLAFDGS
jgi:hypothetical protein